jgi:hypothetical protein
MFNIWQAHTLVAPFTVMMESNVFTDAIKRVVVNADGVKWPSFANVVWLIAMHAITRKQVL